MGSGPGRALIRAEELYDDLDWDEHASAAVLCLETRESPPAEVADFVAERAGVPPTALTLLIAPTASVAGGVQIAARVVETALHKLHELDFDVRRVLAGVRSCPLPPGAGDDMAAIRRTHDPVSAGGRDAHARTHRRRRRGAQRRALARGMRRRDRPRHPARLARAGDLPHRR